MPSLISGFEYDIFISYRHKDNKYDGWVNEFVANLKKELDATLKEDVSIYFDENPLDGLLESHQVDKSLEGKLKCLIFIPVISQTYCDLKSFAWHREFAAFNKMAKEDPFGRDIKVSNGNVTSRILPVRIHDLDTEDKYLLENELGGVLRSIEFVYKSAGVNRPLRSTEDHPQDNLAKTYYRNQINKVANAVKEIITALKVHGHPVREVPKHFISHEPKNKKLRIVIPSLILLALVILAWLFFPSPKKPALAVTHNSIAVLPFTNISNDPEQEYFSDGITEQIISNLAQLKDLKVIARTSVVKYKKTSKTIAEIGKELNVTHILEGSVRKAGDQIRVTAQLIAVNDESHLWAEDFNNTLLTDIFRIQDVVSAKIASTLKNELLPAEREKIKSLKPANPEAYEHYLKAEYIHVNYYFAKFLEEDFRKSEAEFLEAIQLDSNYAMAYAGLANLYDSHASFSYQSHTNFSADETEKYLGLRARCTNKAMALAPQLPMVKLLHYYSFRNYENPNLDSAYKSGKEAYESAPNNSLICHELGQFFDRLGLYDQALNLYGQSMVLNPSSPNEYCALGNIHIKLGNLTAAAEYIKKAQKLDSNSLITLNACVRLNLSKKNYKEVERLVEKMNGINQEIFPFLKALLLAVQGEKEKALKINKTALTYLVLGMKKEAMEKLEQEDHPYLELQNNPILKVLRDDPRFAQVLAKAKVKYESRMKKYPF